MCKLDRNVVRTLAGRVKTRARQAFVVLMGILLVSQTIFSWAGPVFAEEIAQVEEQRAWSQAGEQSGERARQPDGASDGADAADATSVQVGDAAKTAASASTGQASDSGDQVSESPASAATTVSAYNPDAPASEVSQGVTLKFYTDKNHTESFDPA